MKFNLLLILSLSCLGLVSGCAFKRGNVAALSREQSDYYTKLGTTLRTNRARLQLGLTEQLKADLVRQRNLLAWERDLAKAEILLQVDAKTTGNQRLLLMKTAESDLGSLKQVQALNDIDSSRLQALMNLDNAVINAVDALEKNNRVMTNYLNAGKVTFALRSLDVQGVVTAVSTLHDMRDQLKGVEARTTQQKAEQGQRLQNDVNRARDVVLKVLEKQ
jgi:hypothetical protein